MCCSICRDASSTRSVEFFRVSTGCDAHMERRCKFDIIVAILDAVSDGATKTEIVYTANLNTKLADKHLKFLQDYGLVGQQGGVYKITKKGQEYLKKAMELHIWLTVG